MIILFPLLNLRLISFFFASKKVNYNKKNPFSEESGFLYGVTHFGVEENSISWDKGVWINPEPYLMGEKDIRAAGNIGAVEPVKTIDTAIKVGEKVKVLNAVTYDGNPFRVFFGVLYWRAIGDSN